jgi:ribulose-bisphosphate carboxylase small chain
MRITQGAFSFLPDLTDDEIRLQLEYCLEHGWAVSVEYTDDAHPRNTYWEMWGPPMFDLKDPAGIMDEIKACRDAYPQYYIRITAFDYNHGVESVALSFIVNRPEVEPGFWLQRTGGPGREQRYSVVSYAVAGAPEGQRYEPDGSGD